MTTLIKASVAALAAFAIATTATAPARADDSAGRVGVGIQGGTLGIGPSVTYHVNDQLDLHLISGLYKVSPTINSSGTTFATNIQLGGTLGYVDYAPFGGFFRVSAGLFRNVTSVGLSATATNGTVTVNGDQYSTAALGGVNGTLAFHGIAPFVGLGFAKSHFHPKPGISLFGFAGVAFSSPPTTTLAPQNPQAYTTYPQLRSDIAQAQAQAQKTLNIIRIYPAIGLGIQYRF